MRFFLQDIDDHSTDKGDDNVRLLSPQQKKGYYKCPHEDIDECDLFNKTSRLLILWRSKYNYIGSNVYHISNSNRIPRASLRS